MSLLRGAAADLNEAALTISCSRAPSLSRVTFEAGPTRLGAPAHAPPGQWWFASPVPCRRRRWAQPSGPSLCSTRLATGFAPGVRNGLLAPSVARRPGGQGDLRAG